MSNIANLNTLFFHQFFNQFRYKESLAISLSLLYNTILPYRGAIAQSVRASDS